MNNKRKRFLLYEGVIVFIIILSSFMVYAHVLCPDEKNWTTAIFNFTVTYYNSVQMYCFQLLLSISYILLVATWYITCRYWWRTAILIVLLCGIYMFLIVVFAEIPMSRSTYLYKGTLYLLTFLLGLLIIWVRGRLNYPLWNRLQTDGVDAEEILRYKFKNTKHYTKVLNSFSEEIDHSTLQDAKTLIAKAVVLAEEDGNNTSSNTYLDSSTKKDWSGIFIFCIILLIPVFYNLYRFAPATDYWDLGLFKINSFGFPNVYMFLWFITLKLSVFITITIWFLSSRYWWKYFLLIPLIMVSYQIITTLNVNVLALDENEIFKAFPILLGLTSFLLWLSFKIRNITKVEDLKRKIKVEIFNIIAFLGENENRVYEELKGSLNQLIKDKEKYSAEDYLKKLEDIKGRLMQQKKHLL